MPSHPIPATPSDPSPITLASLVQYTDIHEERIRLVLKSHFWLPDQYDEMITLWNDLWGRSDLCLDKTERVQRDHPPDRVNDSLINGVMPDEFDVMVLPSVMN